MYNNLDFHSIFRFGLDPRPKSRLRLVVFGKNKKLCFFNFLNQMVRLEGGELYYEVPYKVFSNFLIKNNNLLKNKCYDINILDGSFKHTFWFLLWLCRKRKDVFTGS